MATRGLMVGAGAGAAAGLVWCLGLTPASGTLLLLPIVLVLLPYAILGAVSPTRRSATIVAAAHFTALLLVFDVAFFRIPRRGACLLLRPGLRSRADTSPGLPRRSPGARSLGNA